MFMLFLDVLWWWGPVLLVAPVVTLLACAVVDRLFFRQGKQISQKEKKKEEGMRGNLESEKSATQGDADVQAEIGEEHDGCCCLHPTRSNDCNAAAGHNDCGTPRGVKKILIAYATQTNTACRLSHKLFSALNAALYDAKDDGCGEGSCSCRPAQKAGGVPEVKILQLAEDGPQCSVEHLLESNAYGLVILIASTYTDGTAPPASQSFAAMLQDAYTDFRVPRDVLSNTKFAIFGLGDVAYGAGRFNRFAKDMYMWCKGLGATFVVPPVYASEANTVNLFNVFTAAVLKWVGRVVFTADGVTILKRQKLQDRLKGKHTQASCNGSSSVHAASDSEEEEEEDNNASDKEGEDGVNGDKSQRRKAKEFNDSEEDVEDLVMGEDGSGDGAQVSAGEPPELLYPRLRSNLERQGYHLVGTHSGVKLCRWTKAMLRGRGGCYKHTFYNIASHQCMEMTPSLACANKCVFCWRHHTNPVSRSFRWKVDPPRELIEGGLAGHQKMIKQMRGVPGVTPERMEEAMQVRHCALSLVGEPIMYPEINTFVDMLHERNISSFMVTNAQFPEQLRDLKPVTQLYLSIDAPTPEELKRVDRPLFEDYWERCLACVRELRRKPQRTVFRLTLVNQYNTENIAAYADLVRLGWPDFIEVKGVTYCGTSPTSTLTMKENVPRHEEVVRFCEALCEALASDTAPREKRIWLTTETEPKMAEDSPVEDSNHSINNGNEDMTDDGGNGDNNEGDDAGVTQTSSGPYGIACEHEHSCCVLIALRRFCVRGVWHTWIDYDKFMALAQSGRTDFTAAEYAAPTPSWAVFRSQEKGFDPTQVRVRRKSGKSAVVTSGC